MIKKVNNEELSEILKNSFFEKSSIGIHGLSFNSRGEVVDLINRIYLEGLRNLETGGVVSNCEMIGTTSSYDNNRLLNYAYVNNDNCVVNLIVNIPLVLEGNNGKYFVGPFEDKHDFQKYDESVNSIWLNELVNEKRLLPSEFIVGAIIYNSETKETIYYSNPNFLGNMEFEKQKQFVDNLVNDYNSDDTIITIDENDIDKTYNMILRYIDIYKEFKQSSYYLEQAKKYIEEVYLSIKK